MYKNVQQGDRRTENNCQSDVEIMEEDSLKAIYNKQFTA